MAFVNSYGNEARAAAYARLGFEDTYYLAYRDIPELLREHVTGRRALDFGCGTGRSTRFLKQQGFKTVGIDISEDMVQKARQTDPAGDYRVIADGDFVSLPPASFDAILSAFTFDNIPAGKKVRLFQGLAGLLAPEGKIIMIVSSPEMYTHEWASFSATPFPENWQAKPGDVVRNIITGMGDDRPVEDILWPDSSYRETFAEAGLAVVRMLQPLATGDEPYAWKNETTIAPWTVYVLRKA